MAYMSFVDQRRKQAGAPAPPASASAVPQQAASMPAPVSAPPLPQMPAPAMPAPVPPPPAPALESMRQMISAPEQGPAPGDFVGSETSERQGIGQRTRPSLAALQGLRY